MDYPKFIVLNQKEESISVQSVKMHVMRVDALFYTAQLCREDPNPQAQSTIPILRLSLENKTFKNACDSSTGLDRHIFSVKL